jgi:CheY-like chemotaxis protein
MYLEAIESKESLPKLIVTDRYLPGITGAEFLKDLKGMDNTNIFTSLYFLQKNQNGN